MQKLTLTLLATISLYTMGHSQNVGVDVALPEQKLDISGGLKLSNTNNGVAGSLRWNNTNFQAHNGTQWVNFGTGTAYNLATVLTEGNNANSLKISNLLDPTADQDAATKAYVDAHTDTDNDLSNELNTSASLNGTNLEITDAGGTLTIALSPLDQSTYNLDDAYDGSRTITADAGAVAITGTSGGLALELDGDIRMAEDQWVGIGSTIERIEFDGSLNRIDMEAADITIDSDKWIGIDASNPRIAFENTNDRLNIQDADIELDNGKWIGLGSSVERIAFDGSSGSINILGADLGLGTTATTEKLDVNGQIRMRTGATNGYVLAGDANGVMTWTDPTTIGAELTSASNGLTEVANDIQLGGSLNQNTTILQGAYTLDFTTTATDGFSVNGSTFSIDGANSRVGIGTSTPTETLHVDGDARIEAGGSMPIVFTSGNFGGGNTTDMLWNENDEGINQEEFAMYNASNSIVANRYFAMFYTSDGDASSLNIRKGGNVGIGTTTPAAHLNVGNASGATLYLTREDSETATGDILGSLLFDSTDDTEPSSTDASAVIRAHASRPHGNSNKGGYITFLTKDNVSSSTSARERIRIQADGNLGIGTTSPSATLEVAGTTRISDLGGTGNKLVTADLEGDLATITDGTAGQVLQTDGFGDLSWIDAVPTGSIMLWSAASAPNGWLICDGSTMNTTTHNELYHVIGTTYGGSGSTFMLPNLEERIPIGASNQAPYTLGNQGGSATNTPTITVTGTVAGHVLTVNEMPAHDHTNGSYDQILMSDCTGTSATQGATCAEPNLTSSASMQSAGGNQSHSHGFSGIGSSSAVSTIQPYLALHYIIKY